ncbi:CD1375 family protein [Paenibacillus sp. OSY-SE]
MKDALAENGITVYCELIKKGLRTLDAVPLRWKGDVQAMLEKIE